MLNDNVLGFWTTESIWKTSVKAQGCKCFHFFFSFFYDYCNNLQLKYLTIVQRYKSILSAYQSSISVYMCNIKLVLTSAQTQTLAWMWNTGVYLLAHLYYNLQSSRTGFNSTVQMSKERKRKFQWHTWRTQVWAWNFKAEVNV